MNSILGRAIMLICIIYLTYYNVAHGLAAIIILIGMHVDSDLEGFRGCNGTEGAVADPEYGTLVEYSEQPVGMSEKAIIPTPVPSPVSSPSSTPSSVPSPNDVTTNKDKTKPIAAPTATATSPAAGKEGFSHHKKLRIEEGMRPKSSKSLNTPFLGTSPHEPSPNWPDNAVFTTSYAPV